MCMINHKWCVALSGTSTSLEFHITLLLLVVIVWLGIRDLYWLNYLCYYIDRLD